MPGSSWCQGAAGAREQLVPGSSWCQGAAGAREQLVPGSSWCQGAAGAREQLVPGSSWCQGAASAREQLVPRLPPAMVPSGIMYGMLISTLAMMLSNQPSVTGGSVYGAQVFSVRLQGLSWLTTALGDTLLWRATEGCSERQISLLTRSALIRTLITCGSVCCMYHVYHVYHV